MSPRSPRSLKTRLNVPQVSQDSSLKSRLNVPQVPQVSQDSSLKSRLNVPQVPQASHVSSDCPPDVESTFFQFGASLMQEALLMMNIMEEYDWHIFSIVTSKFPGASSRWALWTEANSKAHIQLKRIQSPVILLYCSKEEASLTNRNPDFTPDIYPLGMISVSYNEMEYPWRAALETEWHHRHGSRRHAEGERGGARTPRELLQPIREGKDSAQRPERVRAESVEMNYTCVFWSEGRVQEEGGAWSSRGCTKVTSNSTHTVCSCSHLSSFAVLMALYPIKNTFELHLLTWLGLSLSVVCLLLCILTFWLCRSIQGTRTTIHLHLCVCLFIADLVFLSGISHTQSKGGCGFVAGLLHMFFLGSFSWMLLEGVQLYRMVVLVFNTTIRPLYLYTVGYGLPLAIVIISAITYPDGYGTTQHCWLSLERGFIWSFFGPVCTIIILNAFFFIITVWRLAQKFSSLNPDLSNLHKIKVFTVTAVAQLCVLGTMWIFGVFQFQEEGTVVMTYLFTILNSLQGALLFIMHCLLNKTVREEYCKLLSCICTPQKKRYSEVSTTNPSSSQSQGSRSAENTGESQI
ncbi:adhesion G protein-coupled receptor E5-like [Oncorhynchus masou masou]|uniref:adhesion G protein-coupled receptor E5-like n=1 Tax=Oncorhynchus masou masou TaxID=90313 RepID=UPI00318372C0